MKIRHLLDAEVSEDDDRELRALLALCFPRSERAFLRRRFLLEPPDERWLLGAESGGLAAHVAFRQRPVRARQGSFVVGGVSEVCVHPAHRGRGHVPRLIERLHERLRELGLEFALLFGDEAVYRSSGYRPARNTLRHWDPEGLCWVEEVVPSALVRELGPSPWPVGPIDLRGILF